MSSQAPNTHGHPIAAAAVVGSFAFAMALLMRVAGLLDSVGGDLASGYAAQGFPVVDGAAQPWWNMLLVAALVYAVVWLLFETPGTGRRVMMLMTALVLVLALSPVLGLWGVFWSPVGAAVGVAWGGFCAVLWAKQHPMPCELPLAQDMRGGKIIPMNVEEESTEVAEEAPRSKREAKGGKKRRQRRK